MIHPVLIQDRFIGPGYPCFIIAEAGVNHNGNMDIAHQLIDAAVKIGADAVKFQSFVTNELITKNTPKAKYQVNTTGRDDGQYGMLKLLELTPKQQEELRDHCDKAGIIYLCTPYERTSVDILDRLNIVAYKVASTDTTNIPLLRYIASKNRPVLLSTGMSSLCEVELAVNTLKEGGLENKIILLQCTAEYPSPLHEVNLRVIQTMEHAFHCPVGFSDHTPSIGASPWATVLGACVVEKHFTLDRKTPGPDHQASLEPDEFLSLIQTIRDVELALGDGIKQPMPSELSNKKLMQKSLVITRDIKKGEIIKLDDLTCKRPATGLPPFWIDKIIGKLTSRDLCEGTIVELSHIIW